MAEKKPKSAAATASPELLVQVQDAENQLRERVTKGRQLIARPPGDEPSLEQAKQQFLTWDEYNDTLLEKIFSNNSIAQEYSFFGIGFVGGRQQFYERVEEFVDDVSQKVRRLESIIERLPLYAPANSAKKSASAGSGEKSSPVSTRKVFIVHGRNNELKEAVARYLTQLELIPIILHEQANEGRTIIEKFESNADSCFAVALLTPDDIGGLASTNTLADLAARARQNVIFEWGFFVAALGRRKVCALVADGVEMPSDVHGVVYVKLDAEGAWKMLLARELKAGGVDVDLNKAI